MIALGCQPGGEEQTAQGAELYRQRCQSCHETEGGIGPDLSSEVLRYYHSPRALFDYIQMAMPYESPGSLSDEEYWSIVQYLVTSRELLEPVRLDETNAETLTF